MPLLHHLSNFLLCLLYAFFSENPAGYLRKFCRLKLYYLLAVIKDKTVFKEDSEYRCFCKRNSTNSFKCKKKIMVMQQTNQRKKSYVTLAGKPENPYQLIVCI